VLWGWGWLDGWSGCLDGPSAPRFGWLAAPSADWLPGWLSGLADWLAWGLGGLPASAWSWWPATDGEARRRHGRPAVGKRRASGLARNGRRIDRLAAMRRKGGGCWLVEWGSAWLALGLFVADLALWLCLSGFLLLGW